MWELLGDIFWAVFGVFFIYWLVKALYREFFGRANTFIAAENFTKSGKLEAPELPMCTGCGDRHKEPFCYS
jgi:hypothetical protein